MTKAKKQSLEYIALKVSLFAMVVYGLLIFTVVNASL